MAATHKVGGEIDAFCTRCKMTLAHTIIAMMGTKVARVKCNTCGGEHAYRSEPGTSRKPAASRKPREKKVVISFEERLALKDVSAARKYSPRDTYQVEELVDHPTFGVGIVSTIRGDKVDIHFKASEKTLMHGRGEPRAQPAFQPQGAQRKGPADKPPSAEEEPEAPAAPEADADGGGDESAPEEAS